MQKVSNVPLASERGPETGGVGCQRLIPINRTHPCNVLDIGLAFGESAAVAESLVTIERGPETCAICLAAIRDQPTERLVNSTPRDFGIPWPRPVRRQRGGASWRARPGSSWEWLSWPRIGRSSTGWS